MNMERVFGKARLLRALTSLDEREFARLEEAMEKLLASERAERRHDGRPRQRAYGAGGPGKLPTTKARLLFILFYFKCYPLQEALAFLFDMSQPQACEWIKKLTPLVNRALGRELLLPARRPADLDQLLAEVPELRLLVLDGVERPVRRPKDKDDQKQDYSGKKKAHRKKNLLLSSEKRVVYLGPTSPGSVHDKKLADESGLTYPPDALVLKDTGFQGSPRSSPKRSREAVNSIPFRRPSTKSSARRESRSNTPLQGSNAATLSRTSFATVDAASSMKSCSPPAACTTCGWPPARPERFLKTQTHDQNTTTYKV
jgi:hypothetical protein